MKKFPFSFFKMICLFLVTYESIAFGGADKVYIKPEKIESMCQQIFESVQADHFVPELIVGISRGGLVPLGYLSGEKMFNLRTTLSLSIQSYEKQEHEDLKLLLPLHAEDLRHLKSILVIDDIVDSGKTLQFVTSLLKNQVEGAVTKTAALFYKPEKSVVKPDYFVEETDRWIVFPWEDQD